MKPSICRFCESPIDQPFDGRSIHSGEWDAHTRCALQNANDRAREPEMPALVGWAVFCLHDLQTFVLPPDEALRQDLAEWVALTLPTDCPGPHLVSPMFELDAKVLRELGAPE